MLLSADNLSVEKIHDNFKWFLGTCIILSSTVQISSSIHSICHDEMHIVFIIQSNHRNWNMGFPKIHFNSCWLIYDSLVIMCVFTFNSSPMKCPIKSRHSFTVPKLNWTKTKTNNESEMSETEILKTKISWTKD